MNRINFFIILQNEKNINLDQNNCLQTSSYTERRTQTSPTTMYISKIQYKYAGERIIIIWQRELTIVNL